MKTLFMAVVVIVFAVLSCTDNKQEMIDQYDQITCPQLIALDSIAEGLMNEGWTADAAYLIAGFDVDLYDESDTAEYRLYVGYMED